MRLIRAIHPWCSSTNRAFAEIEVLLYLEVQCHWLTLSKGERVRTDIAQRDGFMAHALMLMLLIAIWWRERRCIG
jgi:hypothetical protein